MATSTRPAEGENILSFSVADKQFGLRATDILEVRRTPALTRVPNASSNLAGLMNFHGAAIAVVRLSSLLGLTADSTSGVRESRVLIYGETPPIGLLVDQVIELGAAAGRRKLKVLDLPELLAGKFVAKPVERMRIGDVASHSAAAPPVEATVLLLSFRVSGQRYALPLESVSEAIVLPDAVAVLPRSDTAALGMLEFRGSVLPLISVAALLGLGESPGRRHVLVASLEGVRVGLVVGLIDGVVRIPQAAIEPVPPILQRGEGDAEIAAIARYGRELELISILSPNKLSRNRDIVLSVDGSSLGISAMEEQATDLATLQFVVFRLGQETYALPIGVVDEIVQLPDRPTRVPGAPEFVAGVMNVRGKALPLIDQRRRFQIEGDAGRGRVIVTTVGELQAGFIVDGVSEILRVPASAVSAAPRMPGEGVEVFDRIATAAGDMVLVVDPKELLDRVERDLLSKFSPAGWSGNSHVTRVLIVDDSALMRKFLRRVFEAEAGFEVATAGDGSEALARIGEFRPDVVTLDVEMPNMDGLACLDRIMVEYPCPVVMVSALTEHGADETLEALEMGAVDFVAKPQGTISLHAEEFAPLILERVRTAAGVKIRRSVRLADRLRFHSGEQGEWRPRKRAVRRPLADARSLAADSLVLVGASTGGPPALDALLSSLPADFGWPILIAQHMPETFTASFARRLDGLCELPVVEVRAPTPIEGGTIYIGRGDADMLVGKRASRLVVMPAPSSPDHRWHPSVDRLVATAMLHRAAKDLVGILLTGMGNDGAAAMTELKQAGGHTIAEAEATAVVWGMPGDLVRRGGASDIIELPQIAARLLELSPWR